jgi:uncharacterized membrane protein
VKPTIPIRVFFVVCMAAYPFIVYFGIRHLPPSFFGLALVVLLAMRFGVLVPEERPILLPMLLVFLGYATTAAILKSTSMLLYYPALVNFCLCVVFANSLRQDEPLLLRIIRARGVPISIHTPKYLYRLTAVWATFFAINGSIAIWTSTMSMEIWTLYNGLISYFIVATLIGGELLFRRHYKRRMGVGSP